MSEESNAMESGDDGAVDHRGEALPVLSKRAAKMNIEELMDISAPKNDGKTPGSPFFTTFGYICLRLTNNIQFRSVEFTGQEHIPDTAGTLCCSWHTNGLIDPVEIMLSHPKRFVIGGRHDLVLRPIIGWWARKFAVQPVIRKAELIRGGCSEEEATLLNGRSLRALADGVSSGFGCALFPEGTSHSESNLIRLRTGPMRTVIAAAAISEGLGRPRPVILPIGLHYRVRHHWRTDCWIEYSKPLEIPNSATDDELVKALEAGEWKEPRADAVIGLRDELQARLAPLTPNAPDWKTHRAWHLLGHLRANKSGKPLKSWREEVLAAREAREEVANESASELVTKAKRAAAILDDNGLDGRDIAIDGKLRKGSLFKGIIHSWSLIPMLLTLPLFIYSCGFQAFMGRKLGNKTDEGIDARSTYQFLFAMFGSLIVFPILATVLVLITHSISLFAIPWNDAPFGLSMIGENIFLQIIVEWVMAILLFWLSAIVMVSFCDYVFDINKARARALLRKKKEGEELESLTNELMSLSVN